MLMLKYQSKVEKLESAIVQQDMTQTVNLL